jgi:putative ABC transport system permease protein
VTVELNRGVDPTAWAEKWKAQLAAIDPAAKLRLVRDVREEMDKNLVPVELMSYLGGAVSMLAATFIVFSSLAMGVSERQRTLAMLRAVGATKRQVGSLVVSRACCWPASGPAIGARSGGSG